MFYSNKNDFLPDIEYLGNVINISGKSMPNDPREAWLPFIQEVRDIIEKEKNLTINFKLDIFNTCSSRYFMDVFSTFENYKDKCKITINWYYPEEDEDDDDMKFLGSEYKERFNLDFNLISIKRI